MNSAIILLDKKPGLTSFDTLRDIKRSLGTRKVGHTGTLDKFASGLLVVLAGRALKLSRWFSLCDKKYQGRLHFGIETNTLDPEGDVIAEAPLPSRENVEKALSQFTGEIMQAPPEYSAISVNGQRASDLARKGKPPEMKKRPVSIHKIDLLSWEPPFADIFVHCSSGTYIRSLARDIALSAGSRAHLCSLVRTQVGGFSLDDADGSLRPVNKVTISALGLPHFEITPPEGEKIIQGKPLEPLLKDKSLFFEQKDLPNDGQDITAAVFSEETLVAVVEKTGGSWKYACVLG
ncbi:MAG: tRNA pseudouridine(55) synthase TruB [Treponema sp.]|jgi:tRNA pseudouridine55 synthase|nr:tRNA pseudouridine(55) synthase TruB [Treponema sp.]